MSEFPLALSDVSFAKDVPYMVSIQVDEKTAKAIEMAANIAGLSVAEYVCSLASTKNTSLSTDTWDSIEKQFLELSVEGHLPGAFSRDDIYSDHD